MQPSKLTIFSKSALILMALLSMIAVGAPASSASEPDPILDSLIAAALVNHPDIKAMQRMVEAAEARRTMSRSLMNPDLTVAVMDLPNSLEYNSDPATAFQIGVMQRVPWKGKRKAAEAAAMARVDVDKFGLESARQNMGAMIAMAYYDLGALEEEKWLLKEGVLLTEEMTQAATWMTGSAMGRLSDIEKARLDAEKWKLKILANAGEIKRQRAALAYAVGAPQDTLMLAAARLPFGLPSLISLDSLLVPELLSNAPGIREALAKASAAEKDLARARLNWFPDLDVMLSYDLKPDLKSMGGVDHTGQPLPAGTIDQMNMISAGVTFPIPLFAQGNQRAEIAEMTAMRYSAAAKASNAKLALENEIRQLHASWEEQNNFCAFVQETIIGRAESLYQTALIDYQAGRTPFMELSQARMSLVMAKMELAMSRGLAWGARAKLLSALGNLAPKTVKTTNY